MKKRLVSGIQPTGSLHIGNYLGAIKQWVELQHQYDCYFFLADYHTLTVRLKPEVLYKNILELTALLIALGIDPKNCVLFRQSDIPQHTELGWVFDTFTSIGQLNRMTQYKEKSDRHGQNAGLFTYPALQAADVALYDGEIVPIGEDQVQHLELAREIIRSLNHHTGKQTLIEPKAKLTDAARIMALNNPKVKMSKSVPGSAIGLLDNEADIIKTIRRAVTDSDLNSAEMSPGVKNLFVILGGISSKTTIDHFQGLFKEGRLQYSELKEQLIEDILAFLGPVQKAYTKLIADEDLLLRTLSEGDKKAKPIAEATMRRVKNDLGLIRG